MIDNLKELNNKINTFVDYIVKTACESTTSGNYTVDVRDGLKAVGLGFGDFVEHKNLIFGEIEAREEVLDFNYGEQESELDINCALDYCPNYEWCDGDEQVFECSYEEWLERPVKPVAQLAIQETEENKAVDSNVYFTVRDGFGDDIGDAQYPSFEKALKVLRNYCAERGEDSDGAMLGIVCKSDDKTHKCVLVQNVINKYNEAVLKPMYNNISWETLDVPEIELAALKGKQLQYPFDEVTQSRIDYLEKRLGIYDRDIDTSGDLYVGKWRVHVLAPGDKYGLNNCLEFEDKDSCVEFWDMSLDKERFPEGQFTGGRYYISTLLSDEWGSGPEVLMKHGLCLNGDCRDVWSVSGDEMKKVYEWLKNRPLADGEHYLSCSGKVDIPHSLDSSHAWLYERLSVMAFVRDLKVEHVASHDDCESFAFSFVSQAEKSAVEKAMVGLLAGYSYELGFEAKKFEGNREALDSVITKCAAQVKNEPAVKGKDNELEK